VTLESGCRCAVYPSLPAAWTALDPDPPLFAARPWLDRMGHRIEGSHRWFVCPDGVGFFGSVIDDPAVTLSKNPWTLLFEPAEAMRTLTPDSLRRQAAVRAATAAAPDWFPALVLIYPGAECFAIGPGATSPAAVGAAVDSIVRYARAEGIATIAFLFVQPEDTPLIAALRDRGLVEFVTALRCNLRLPGSSFADYLRMLERIPRQDVHRTRRRLAENGVRLLSRPLAECTEADLDSFVGLRQQHRAKYGKRPDAASERKQLAELHTYFADRMTAFTAVADDRLLGFSLLLDAGPMQHAWLVGTDYRDARSKLTYFELTYYRAVEHAYAHGHRDISFGYGTERAKSRRGCQVDLVNSYLLALDPGRQRQGQQAAATLELA